MTVKRKERRQAWRATTTWKPPLVFPVTGGDWGPFSNFKYLIYSKW